MRRAQSQDTHSSSGAFIAELRRWREVRGLSQTALAREMDYTASYVSKVEGGQQPPTHAFAQRAEQVLEGGGTLMRRWREFDRMRRSGEVPRRPATERSDAYAGPTSLVVEHEDARLDYRDGKYHLRIRRTIHNESEQPVTRYLIRIAVDRYPGSPARSNELYRERPLTWEELGLFATCEGEQMSCEAMHDRDAFKEVWLLFENDAGKFPLYPGETACIEYGYVVSDEKWGRWFQRAIRVPTRSLTVQLAFPAALEPAVWGLETSMSSERVPVRPAIVQRLDDQRRLFSWSTTDPPLHTRFRFEWRFKGDDGAREPQPPPSVRMRRLGILQSGDPHLREPCEPFDLPAEAEAARALGELLVAYLDPIRHAHVFSKGVGLAAPQIGVRRAAAVVELPGEQPLVLFNPRIAGASEEADEQFEGCLSFFDVRGTVRRALCIDIEHTTLDGTTRVMRVERGAARLWAHEIDHLAGVLYADRLVPGGALIPVERYEGAGERWRYT